MKKFLLVIILTFSSIVHAQWILVSENINVKIFIEMKSIQQINQYKRAWVKDEYSSNSEMVLKHNLRSGRYYEEYDCREKKYRELSSHFFKQSDLIDPHSNNNTVMEWKFVAPESADQDKLDFVCKKK